MGSRVVLSGIVVWRLRLHQPIQEIDEAKAHLSNDKCVQSNKRPDQEALGHNEDDSSEKGRTELSGVNPSHRYEKDT